MSADDEGSMSGGGSSGGSSSDEFGHLVVERSGGIGGLLLVWDLDIDSSDHREQIGPQIAELPWGGEDSAAQADSGSGTQTGSGGGVQAGAARGADRYVYAIESRFGLVRFGEAEMPGEWKRLVDTVRDVAEPQRRRPGDR